MDCSQQTAAEVDREVQRILDEAYADAKAMLTRKRDLLDEIALYLLAKETITGEELMAYVNADKQAQAAKEEEKNEE
jgi:cell division protease FtsH